MALKSKIRPTGGGDRMLEVSGLWPALPNGVERPSPPPKPWEDPMLRKPTRFLLAAGVLFSIGTLPASAEKQTLRMAYWAGPSHQMVQTLAAWIKTIEEASGGNLTVEVDKAGLAKMEGQYDLIRNGVRDLGWAVP